MQWCHEYYSIISNQYVIIFLCNNVFLFLWFIYCNVVLFLFWGSDIFRLGPRFRRLPLFRFFFKIRPNRNSSSPFNYTFLKCYISSFAKMQYIFYFIKGSEYCYSVYSLVFFLFFNWEIIFCFICFFFLFLFIFFISSFKTTPSRTIVELH